MAASRDHVYRRPSKGERCRSRGHDKAWETAAGEDLFCTGCGRCFWCADRDRCPAKNSGAGGAEPTVAGAVNPGGPAAPVAPEAA